MMLLFVFVCVYSCVFVTNQQWSVLLALPPSAISFFFRNQAPKDLGQL